ncbi:MAG: GNAT family N-acetyltransferase [Betaproteobacteria bacterium]
METTLLPPDVAVRWIDALSPLLAAERAFSGCSLRAAARADEGRLFALHRHALRAYVDATWGWNDAWQRAYFSDHYAASRNALVMRDADDAMIGRVSLSRHWRKIFLRDIELVATERNRGLGSALIRAVLALARESDKAVELLVLDCNPARHLYRQLGFETVSDDGARSRMRAA